MEEKAKKTVATTITDKSGSQKDAAVEAFTGAVKDTAISALKGIVGVPEAFVKIADIPTGGGASKLAEKVGYKPKETREFLDSKYSPDQKAANLKVSQAEGFKGTVSAALKNPTTIAHSIVEAAPSLIGSGGLAKGALSGIAKVLPKAASLGTGVIAKGAGMLSKAGSAESAIGALGKGTNLMSAASKGTGILSKGTGMLKGGAINGADMFSKAGAGGGKLGMLKKGAELLKGGAGKKAGLLSKGADLLKGGLSGKGQAGKAGADGKGQKESTIVSDLQKAVNEGNPFPLIMTALSSVLKLGKGLGKSGIGMASALSNSKLTSMITGAFKAKGAGTGVTETLTKGLSQVLGR